MGWRLRALTLSLMRARVLCEDESRCEGVDGSAWVLDGFWGLPARFVGFLSEKLWWW